MNSLPWFRMYSRIVTDPEVEELSFEDQRHYVWLLCLKNDGHLDKGYDGEKLDRMLSRKLGLYGEAFESAKRRLMGSGLLTSDWQPRSWDALQASSDSSSDRTRAWRARQKEAREQAVTEAGRHGDALDKNREEQKTDMDADAPTSAPASDDVVLKATRARSASPPADFAQSAIDAYHENFPASTMVTRFKWTQPRGKALAGLFRDEPMAKKDGFWAAYFETASTWDWWAGRKPAANGDVFNADFAFLVKRVIFDRVIEMGVDADRRSAK